MLPTKYLILERLDFMKKTCPNCNLVFETIYPDKVYCSERCRNAFLERKRRTKNRKAECRKCGSPMPLMFGRGAFQMQVCDVCKKKEVRMCVLCNVELKKRQKKYCASCAKQQKYEYSKSYQRTDKGREAWKKAVAKWFRTKNGLAAAIRGFHKRKAKMKSLPADFTNADWKKALAYFGHRCVYCGVDGSLQQDHFVPVAKGGGYTRRNIVPACQSCNSKKHDKDPFVWLSGKPNGIEIYKNIVSYLEV